MYGSASSSSRSGTINAPVTHQPSYQHAQPAPLPQARYPPTAAGYYTKQPTDRGRNGIGSALNGGGGTAATPTAMASYGHPAGFQPAAKRSSSFQSFPPQQGVSSSIAPDMGSLHHHHAQTSEVGGAAMGAVGSQQHFPPSQYPRPTTYSSFGSSFDPPNVQHAVTPVQAQSQPHAAAYEQHDVRFANQRSMRDLHSRPMTDGSGVAFDEQRSALEVDAEQNRPMENTGKMGAGVGAVEVEPRQYLEGAGARAMQDHGNVSEFAATSASSAPQQVHGAADGDRDRERERAASVQIARQMSQVAGDVATCVHQNELVISLLERLVSLTESLASSSDKSAHLHPAPQIAVTRAQESAPAALPDPVASDPHPSLGEAAASSSYNNRRDILQPPLENTANSSPGSEYGVVGQAAMTGNAVQPGNKIARPLAASYDQMQQSRAQHAQTRGLEHAPPQDKSAVAMTHQEPFQELSEAFDDPLNFIGTPASITHHQQPHPAERLNPSSLTYAHQQTGATMSSSVVHPSSSTLDDTTMETGATPHSGPPRYGPGASTLDDGPETRIESPAFGEHVPHVDESFPSFDLSVSMAPRRNSRRISLRNGSLLPQRQGQTPQQSQQLAKHSHRAQVADHFGHESVDRRQDDENSSEASSSNPATPSGKDQSPVLQRGKSTRGRKRKAIFARDSLRSNRSDTPQGRGKKENEQAARSSGREDSLNNSGYDDSEWHEWIEARKPPAAALRNMRPARYQSLKEVRLDRKQKTNRSLSTIGRIPLKEYLEVGGDAEYRAVRRLARTVYNSWLESNVRLAKQDPHRLTACYHRIEYAFPILADCEGHWKARELMLQVIDNAIDELAFQKRKEARMFAQSSGAGGERRDKRRTTKDGAGETHYAKKRRRKEEEGDEGTQDDDVAGDEDDEDDEEEDEEAFDEDDDSGDDDGDEDRSNGRGKGERAEKQKGRSKNSQHSSLSGSNGAAHQRSRRRAYTIDHELEEQEEDNHLDASVGRSQTSFPTMNPSGHSLWSAGINTHAIHASEM